MIVFVPFPSRRKKETSVRTVWLSREGCYFARLYESLYLVQIPRYRFFDSLSEFLYVAVSSCLKERMTDGKGKYFQHSIFPQFLLVWIGLLFTFTSSSDRSPNPPPPRDKTPKEKNYPKEESYSHQKV